VYNGQPYSDSALANLFNDKFVAVGNSLPPLAWTPLEVGVFLPTFTLQSPTPRKHYNPSSSFQLQVLTKSRLGSSVKIPRYYFAH
jgi:hypothetical protein